MVRLVLFDRRLDIATDDLYLPSAIIAIFRIIWIAALTFTIIIIFSDHCELPRTVGLYVFMHLILCLFCLFTEVCSVYVSMSGTVNNEKPRGKITYLSHVETVLIISDLALQIYGTYVTYNNQMINDSLACSNNSISIALVKMVVVWAFICDFVFIFVFGIFVFISKPRKLNSDVQNYFLTWKRRIEWFLSNPDKMDRKGDSQKVIADVAGLFARFFKDVDWAPSDMAVGLILLKREQKILRQVTELRRAHPVSASFWENLLRSQNPEKIELEPTLASSRISNYSPNLRYTSPLLTSQMEQSSLQYPLATASSRDSISILSISSSLEIKEAPKDDLVETPKGIEMQRMIRKDGSAETLQENNRLDSSQPVSSISQERKKSLSSLPSPKSANASSSHVTFQSFIQSLNLRNPLDLVANFPSTYNTPEPGNPLNSNTCRTTTPYRDSRRRSEVLERNVELTPLRTNNTKKPRPRSYSFTLASKTLPQSAPQAPIPAPKSPTTSRQSNDWSFSAYSFNVSPNATEMKRPDILDVIHFCHYANMAYVTLDPEIQKKSDILLHFSPRNHLYQAPYLVSLDHDWNSIVIAIRGTYSISDVMVDLKLDTDVLDVDLEGAEGYQVHAGFLKTARNIVDDIIKHDVLGKTMRNGKESLYQVVVCGHSLGAGLSSIVAYLLRKRGFHRTRCYGYGMPCVGNDLVAKLFNEFCLSVVVGDDLICRLSINTCDILKGDVARLLDRCNLPKYKIFASAIANNCMSCCGEEPEKRKSLLTRTQNGLFPEGSAATLQESEIRQIVENAARHSTTAVLQRALKPEQVLDGAEQCYTQLYIPGRILYIEKVRISSPVLVHNLRNRSVNVSSSEQQSGGAKRKRGVASLNAMTQALQERLIIAKYRSFDSKYIYTPRWAQKEEFCEIVVSRTMIRDHTAVFGIMGEFDNTDPDEALKVLS